MSRPLPDTEAAASVHGFADATMPVAGPGDPESEGPDRGATFTLTLPLVPPERGLG